MAPRAFLLLALAFAVVLLITSEVAAAKELAEKNDSEINDSGPGGYSKGGGGGYSKGGGGHGGKDGGRGCRHGCCGGRRSYSRGGCKCCSSFEEATAYKQTQN